MLQFGSFTLDPDRCELRRSGEPIPLERKIFDVLRYLVEHRERVVSRDELLERVWEGVAVSTNSITRAATVLRRALDDDAHAPRWIATVHGRGYRFIGELHTPSDVRAVPTSGRRSAGEPRRLLVGRGAEQAALREAMADALDGGLHVMLIEGEPGIGKSRLLDWCAEEAPRSSLQMIASRCREDEGAPALAPWLEIMRQLQGVLALDAPTLLSSAAPSLAHLFPDLETFSDVDVASDPDRDGNATRTLRFEAFTALASVLRETCRAKPLALVLDDLHRADTTSIELLEFLVSRLVDADILIVAAMRPEGVGRAELLRIARDPRCRTIALKGLGEDHVRTLLDAAHPDHASADLAREIWRQTGGNPFFVHQVLPLATSIATSPDAEASIARALPRTVRKAIEQQCAVLSRPALAALRAAAVIGRELSAQPLADALAQSLEDTLDQLDEALRANVLAVIPDATQRYRFTHLLVRDVIYEELATHERCRLHGRVGAALEATHPDASQIASELAHHFTASGAPAYVERAIQHHLAAGDFAGRRMAHTVAVEHYRSALQLMSAGPIADARRRSALLLDLGFQVSYAGHRTEAVSLWLEAAEQARTCADPEPLVCAAVAFWIGLDGAIPGVPVARVVAVFEEAIRRTTSYHEKVRARLWTRLAVSLGAAERHEQARRALDTALGLARISDDPLALSEALLWDLATRLGTPHAHERLATVRELTQQASRGLPLSMQLAILTRHAAALGELGRFDEFDAVARDCVRMADDMGRPASIALMSTLPILRMVMRGEWDAARPLIARAIEVARHCNPGDVLELGVMQLAIQLETSGVPPELTQLLDRPGSIGWVTIRLFIYQQLERRDVIDRDVDAAIAQVARQRAAHKAWLIAGVTLAEPIAYLNDARRAALVLDWFDGFEELHALAYVYYGPVRRAIGLLQRTLGRTDEAVDSAQVVLRQMTELRAPPWQCRAHLDLATAHARRAARSDLTQARLHANEALRLAEKLGMKYAERSIHALLAELGRTPA